MVIPGTPYLIPYRVIGDVIVILSDVKGDLRRYFPGAGIQHFTGQSLNRFILPIAPTPKIALPLEKLELLFAETQRLESIYQQKLTALAELKQSLLQKAFSGELTAEDTTVNQEVAA